MSGLKRGDLELARKLKVLIEGRSNSGIDDTDVMRYERIRVDRGRHDMDVEGTSSEAGESMCWGMLTAVDTWRRLCVRRRCWVTVDVRLQRSRWTGGVLRTSKTDVGDDV